MLSLLSSFTSASSASSSASNSGASSPSPSPSPALDIVSAELDVESEPAAVSEEAISAFIAAYCKEQWHTAFRQKQLIKMALKDAPPAPPGLTDCCGSSCMPCVKHVWTEENRMWYESRGLEVKMPEKKEGELSW